MTLVSPCRFSLWKLNYLEQMTQMMHVELFMQYREAEHK